MGLTLAWEQLDASMEELDGVWFDSFKFGRLESLTDFCDCVDF